MFLAVLFWQWRLYSGEGSIGALGRTVNMWLLRILVAVTLGSLVFMVIQKPDNPVAFIPELSLLFLIAALYSMARADKSLARVLKDLPLELFKVIGVAIACLAGWALSLGLGWLVFTLVAKLPGNPDALAVVVIGLLWNAPLVLLYRGIQTKSKNVPDGMKFYKLLWPVLAAYLLIMLPEFIELVANAPKIQQMMQAGPPLQRV